MRSFVTFVTYVQRRKKRQRKPISSFHTDTQTRAYANWLLSNCVGRQSAFVKCLFEFFFGIYVYREITFRLAHTLIHLRFFVQIYRYFKYPKLARKSIHWERSISFGLHSKSAENRTEINTLMFLHSFFFLPHTNFHPSIIIADI